MPFRKVLRLIFLDCVNVRAAIAANLLAWVQVDPAVKLQASERYKELPVKLNADSRILGLKRCK